MLLTSQLGKRRQAVNLGYCFRQFLKTGDILCGAAANLLEQFLLPLECLF